jgi:hypothetical protein
MIQKAEIGDNVALKADCEWRIEWGNVSAESCRAGDLRFDRYLSTNLDSGGDLGTHLGQ